MLTRSKTSKMSVLCSAVDDLNSASMSLTWARETSSARLRMDPLAAICFWNSRASLWPERMESCAPEMAFMASTAFAEDDDSLWMVPSVFSCQTCDCRK